MSPTVHPRRVAAARSAQVALAGSTVLLAGCFECQEIRVVWTALPPGDWVSVDTTFVNVTKDGFGCTDAVQCVEQLRRWMATASPGTPFGSDSWVAREGATERQVTLHKHGRALDLRVHLELSVDAPLLHRWGAERDAHSWVLDLPSEARPGRKAAELMPGRWRFRDDEASFRWTLEDEVVPLFETWPELEALLVAPPPAAAAGQPSTP